MCIIMCVVKSKLNLSLENRYTHRPALKHKCYTQTKQRTSRNKCPQRHATPRTGSFSCTNRTNEKCIEHRLRSWAEDHRNMLSAWCWIANWLCTKIHLVFAMCGACLSSRESRVFECKALLCCWDWRCAMGSNGTTNRPRNTFAYNIKWFGQSVGPRCGSRTVFV